MDEYSDDSSIDSAHHYGLGMEVPSPVGPVPKSTPSVSSTSLNREYGKGFSMLQKMGFKTGTGLGKHGEGIVEPIEIEQRKKGAGIGEKDGPKKGKFSKEELFGKRDTVVSGPPRAPLTSEERELIHAKKILEDLTEKKNSIEYQIFVLRSSPFFSDSEIHLGGDLDDLLSDLIKSGLFGKTDIGAFESTLIRITKHIDTLRDKYDSNPLWYGLDVESVVAAAVNGLVGSVSYLSPSHIRLLRDLIISEDDFSRCVEFQILKKIDHTDIDMLESLMSCVGSESYRVSIYERFVDALLVEKIREHGLRWMLGKIDILVPDGVVKETFILAHIKPILDRAEYPNDLLVWETTIKSNHPEIWQSLILRKSADLILRLRRLDISDLNRCEEVVLRVISWTSVVPPLVIGCILSESGFIGNWCIGVQKLSREDQFRVAKIWLPMLAPVTYHSPAKLVLIDFLNKLKREDTNKTRRIPGPPAAFFSNRESPGSAAARATLGDVVRDRCEQAGVPLVPKPGVRENGCQVYRVGLRTVYWQDDALFVKVDESEWVETGIESIFR